MCLCVCVSVCLCVCVSVCAASVVSVCVSMCVYLCPAALCEVSRLSKEDLNANAIKNVGRDEVPVCALRFAFSLCLCVTRCLLSPNVRS